MHFTSQVPFKVRNNAVTILTSISSLSFHANFTKPNLSYETCSKARVFFSTLRDIVTQPDLTVNSSNHSDMLRNKAALYSLIKIWKFHKESTTSEKLTKHRTPQSEFY